MNYDTEAMAQALYEEAEPKRPIPWHEVPRSGQANWIAAAGRLIQRYITTSERRAAPCASQEGEPK